MNSTTLNRHSDALVHPDDVGIRSVENVLLIYQGIWCHTYEESSFQTMFCAKRVMFQ